MGWGAVAAACVMAGPAGATHHRTAHANAPAHHETSHHDAPAHHAAAHRGNETHHAAHTSRSEHQPSVIAGGTTVPAGGIKLYCGPGKSPLMVRKMTQGTGTTVTVICR
jgi:hypothetical protein